ncbi:hypothetical protein B484DRAFT_389616, partial [Ochromonadaceae sp. CCMP2298]
IILVGTAQGNLCGYQELHSVIEEVPVFFLRLGDFAPLDRTGQTGRLGAGPHHPHYPHPEHPPTSVHRVQGHGPGQGRGHGQGNQVYPEAARTLATSQAQAAARSQALSTAASTASAVLWMQSLSPSTIMVGYQSGKVVLWDLEKQTRLEDLPLNGTSCDSTAG